MGLTGSDGLTGSGGLIDLDLDTGIIGEEIVEEAGGVVADVTG